MTTPSHHLRPGRSILPVLAFLAAFSLLLWLVADQFLVPGMEAAKEASTGQKRHLVAWARLLLAIVLLILCVGILLAFPLRNFFFPRQASKRQKTEYIDAWAEAGKRVRVDDDSSSSDSVTGS